MNVVLFVFQNRDRVRDVNLCRVCGIEHRGRYSNITSEDDNTEHREVETRDRESPQK